MVICITRYGRARFDARGALRSIVGSSFRATMPSIEVVVGATWDYVESMLDYDWDRLHEYMREARDRSQYDGEQWFYPVLVVTINY